MNIKTVISILMVLLPGYCLAADGIISVQSRYSVEKTLERLENTLHEKGMKIIARVNHSDAARKAGITLRDTALILFGNPKVGSPLMKCRQTAALDLPQKALVYEDADGMVWLAYNDPAYLKTRHAMEGCDEVLARITAALHQFAKTATQ